jgi:pSer/pThr/pTyr-binding forkhead associated (FHA) protein
MDLFLKACGMLSPLELKVEHPGQHETIRCLYQQPFVLIGREAPIDLLLEHAHVGRRHAYLQVLAGRVFCLDFGGPERTYRKQASRPSAWLVPGEALDVGPFQVQLLHGVHGPGPALPGAGDPLAAGAFGQHLLPALNLEFVNNSSGPPRWSMNRVLALIGRAPECKVRLGDASVSRVHCSLVRTPLGAWVIDLRSREGVHVNGAQVRCARLTDGDEIRVGRYAIYVRYDRPLPPEPVQSLPADRALVPAPPQPARVYLPASYGATTWPGEVAPLPLMISGTPPPPRTDAAAYPLVPTQAFAPVVVGQDFGAAAVQAYLAPVFCHFALMQQQMFDQFQQAILMMAQTFGRLHQDQMDVIRSELDGLHDLTREISTLQEALAKHLAAKQDSPAASPQAAPPEVAAAALASATAPAVSRPAAEAKSPNGSPVGGRVNPDQRAPARAMGSPAGVPRTATPAAQSAAKGDPLGIPVSPVSQPTAGVASAPIQPSEDIHAWLSQRIATLQQERQTRWQRVVQLVLGKQTETPVP